MYNKPQMTTERKPRRVISETNCRPNLSLVPNEAYKAVGTLLKDVFPEDAREGDEASWWVPQEDLMDLQTACIKFKIAGVDHKELAKIILVQNPRIRAARTLGGMPDNQFESMRSRLAEVILPHYPANYRTSYETKKIS